MQIQKSSHVKPGSRPATPWEIAMAAQLGMTVEQVRVPSDCPAFLTKEQQAAMRDLVTPGSVAHKKFTKAAE